MSNAHDVQAFVCEDPVESDENTARTMTDRHLEEMCAELNRAYLLLRQGKPWGDICHAPSAKKVKELKMFYLPERSLLPGATQDNVIELIHSTGLPQDVKEKCNWAAKPLESGSHYRCS